MDTAEAIKEGFLDSLETIELEESKPTCQTTDDNQLKFPTDGEEGDDHGANFGNSNSAESSPEIPIVTAPDLDNLTLKCDDDGEKGTNQVLEDRSPLLESSTTVLTHCDLTSQSQPKYSKAVEGELSLDKDDLQRRISVLETENQALNSRINELTGERDNNLSKPKEHSSPSSESETGHPQPGSIMSLSTGSEESAQLEEERFVKIKTFEIESSKASSQSDKENLDIEDQIANLTNQRDSLREQLQNQESEYLKAKLELQSLLQEQTKEHNARLSLASELEVVKKQLLESEESLEEVRTTVQSVIKYIPIDKISTSSSKVDDVCAVEDNLSSIIKSTHPVIAEITGMVSSIKSIVQQYEEMSIENSNMETELKLRVAEAESLKTEVSELKEKEADCIRGYQLVSEAYEKEQLLNADLQDKLNALITLTNGKEELDWFKLELLSKDEELMEMQTMFDDKLVEKDSCIDAKDKLITSLQVQLEALKERSSLEVQVDRASQTQPEAPAEAQQHPDEEFISKVSDPDCSTSHPGTLPGIQELRDIDQIIDDTNQRLTKTNEEFQLEKSHCDETSIASSEELVRLSQELAHANETIQQMSESYKVVESLLENVRKLEESVNSKAEELCLCVNAKEQEISRVIEEYENKYRVMGTRLDQAEQTLEQRGQEVISLRKQNESLNQKLKESEGLEESKLGLLQKEIDELCKIVDVVSSFLNESKDSQRLKNLNTEELIEELMRANNQRLEKTKSLMHQVHLYGEELKKHQRKEKQQSEAHKHEIELLENTKTKLKVAIQDKEDLLHREQAAHNETKTLLDSALREKSNLEQLVKTKESEVQLLCTGNDDERAKSTTQVSKLRSKISQLEQTIRELNVRYEENMKEINAVHDSELMCMQGELDSTRDHLTHELSLRFRECAALQLKLEETKESAAVNRVEVMPLRDKLGALDVDLNVTKANLNASRAYGTRIRLELQEKTHLAEQLQDELNALTALHNLCSQVNEPEKDPTLCEHFGYPKYPFKLDPLPTQQEESASSLQITHGSGDHELLEKKIQLLQEKISEIEQSEVQSFEQCVMLKEWTRRIELENLQLRGMVRSDGKGSQDSKVRILQEEVMRLISSLEERERHCEHLTLELARILEERDVLQLKLAEGLEGQTEVEQVEDNTLPQSGSSSDHSSTAILSRLKEMQFKLYCQSIDLRREKDVRKILEEQLLLSQTTKLYKDMSIRGPLFQGSGLSSPASASTVHTHHNIPGASKSTGPIKDGSSQLSTSSVMHI